MILSKLFEGIDIIEKNVDDDLDIEKVSSDSRKMEKKSAFVCLKGTKYDGHIWIDSALENGASLIVCQEKPRINIPYVLVENTRPVLPKLLSNLYDHPENSFETRIGITGTNGKTSTSFMLKKIFEDAGRKTVLLGTTKYLVGNEEYPVDKNAAFLTTPDPELLYEILKYAREKKCNTLIMEVSSHSLYFKKVETIRFTHGVFTNLTQDHLDFHKNMQEYMLAKKNLFYQCDIGIFNKDDSYFEALSEKVPCKVKTFSIADDSADYFAKDASFASPEGISYKMGKQNVSIPIPGKFTVYNSLCAIATANAAGIELGDAAKSLSEMQGVKGRIERIPLSKPYSVFIDFAHTPDALENVTRTLREFTSGRLITLFGCGGDRDKTKRPIMARIALKMSDYVIITSDNSRTEEKEDIINDILEGTCGSKTPYISIVDRTEAIKYALGMAKKGDTVLLAGKGHEEYEIDKTGKHYYSEREIVLSISGDKND